MTKSVASLEDHPDFEKVAGIYLYVGKADPPTDEEWEQYLASAPDDETRAEWASHRKDVS